MAWATGGSSSSTSRPGRADSAPARSEGSSSRSIPAPPRRAVPTGAKGDLSGFLDKIGKLGRCGDWEEALARLRATEHSVELAAWNAVIGACLRNKEWRVALGLVSELRERELEPDEITLGALAVAFREAKKWESCLDVLEEFPHLQLQLTAAVLGTAIGAAAAAKQWQLVLESFATMRSQELAPDQVTMGTVLSACGSGLLWQLALALLDEMRHLKVRSNVICFNTVGSSCSRASEWSTALQLFLRAAERGIELSEVSAGVSMEALAQQGWEAALLSLLAQRLHTGPMCSSALKACAKGGAWPLALDLLGKAPSWDCSSCGLAIAACGKAEMWGAALHLFHQDMPHRHLWPDAPIWNAVIAACSWADRSPMGLIMLKKMDGAGFPARQDTLRSLLEALAEGGNWAAAFSLLSRLINDGGAQTVCFNLVAKAMCSAGFWELALSVLEKLEAHGIQSDLATERYRLTAFKLGSCWQDALSVLQRVQRAGWPPEKIPYQEVLSACRRASAWVQAVSILGELWQDGIMPSNYLCNTAIGACKRAGEWQQVLRLLQQMEQCFIETDLVTYTAALGACEAASRWEAVLRLLWEMRRQQLSAERPTVLSLVRTFFKSPKLRPALTPLCQELERQGLLSSDQVRQVLEAASTQGGS